METLQQDARDEAFMREALAEAAKGEGLTRPNPPVGAVLARGGVALGRGWHKRAGAPHAEAEALDDARRNGARTEGATLFVTLEPCSTAGRTPPCTQAVIAAGISRVVVACEDENPRHRGAGLRILRDAGIEVSSGVCAAEARVMLAPFFKHVATGRPFLTLKIAQSLDGALADHCGASKWITGAEARGHVKRELRRKCDAALAGCGTVVADDPSLLREDGSGLRAVLDPDCRISAGARIFTDGHAAQTIVFAAEDCAPERLAAVCARGVAVHTLPRAAGGRGLDLPAALARLGEAGLMHVMCEGGAALASSIINGRLADELLLFVAPIILGAGAKRSFGAHPFDLPTAPGFAIESVRRLGADIMLHCVPA